eukprot:8734495-Alexandrium_andersonii.AAC.1
MHAVDGEVPDLQARAAKYGAQRCCLLGHSGHEGHVTPQGATARRRGRKSQVVQVALGACGVAQPAEGVRSSIPETEALGHPFP